MWKQTENWTQAASLISFCGKCQLWGFGRGAHLAHQEWSCFLMTLALAIKMVAFSGVLNRWFLPDSYSQLLFLSLHFQSVIKACQFGLLTFLESVSNYPFPLQLPSPLLPPKPLQEFIKCFYSHRFIPALLPSISCCWRPSKSQIWSPPFLPWRLMFIVPKRHVETLSIAPTF